MSVEIKLKRADKTYHEGDVVNGLVCISSKDSFSHQGITLTVEGTVNLQLSAKSVGVFEAFYNSLKPVQIMSYTLELAKPGGKIPANRTEIPFEFPLKSTTAHKLYESYHGVFVNISYIVKVDIKRGAFSKDLTKSSEFIVEYRGEKIEPKEVPFSITPSSIENAKGRTVPNFLIEGKLHNVNASITRPFTGEVKVVKSDVAVKSIELQLVRVETCGCQEGFSKDTTEIQNIQIGDGNVLKDFEIPVYMVFPRLFTCPSIQTDTFKIEFEVNIVVVTENADVITENFPITLLREVTL